MITDGYRERLAERYNIPADLLRGEDDGDLTIQALALNRYREKIMKGKTGTKKPTREQFAEWMGEKPKENPYNQESTAEQFAAWAEKVMR